MLNRKILSILLTTTFITTTARAEDTTLTVDMLNSATDNFEWSTTASSDDTGSIESSGTNFYYKYNKPDDYSAVTTDSSVADLTSGSYAVSGVGLTNNADLSTSSLNGDFISATLTNTGNLGSINGDWVGSSGTSVAVSNYNNETQQLVSIGNINGNFIGTGGIENVVEEIARTNGYRVQIGDITASLISSPRKMILSFNNLE